MMNQLNNSISFPFQNISENGLDAWFKLEGRSNKKSVKGRIRLKISLSTKVSTDWHNSPDLFILSVICSFVKEYLCY